MTKITKKSRIARMYRLHFSVEEMMEVSGLKRATIKQYIWQIKNPEKFKALNKRTYEKARDKKLKYSKEYYYNNYEDIREKQKIYCFNNYEKLKETRKQKRLQFKE